VESTSTLKQQLHQEKNKTSKKQRQQQKQQQQRHLIHRISLARTDEILEINTKKEKKYPIQLLKKSECASIPHFVDLHFYFERGHSSNLHLIKV